MYADDELANELGLFFFYTTEPSMLSLTKRGLMVIGKELPGFIADFLKK